MSREQDSFRLSAPRIYLVRMLVFMALATLVALVLYKPVMVAFWANPALNALIFLVLLIGVLLCLRQVFRLFAEVNWVNSVRKADQRILPETPPVLLAPMASLLGDKVGRSTISTLTFRSVLDSIGARLDEARDISRYLTGLLVFLGLLGTFWGLLETVGSIGKVISSMPTNGDAAVLFDELKSGLAAPLAGMGISFSSSLFGLAGSLILGFLDLQAGQAQNRFFYELEDWLSTMTQDTAPASVAPVSSSITLGADFKQAVDRLMVAVHDVSGAKASTTANAAAMANLADGVQGLVQQMRAEQQSIRNWVEFHADQQQDLKRLIEKLLRDLPAGKA